MKLARSFEQSMAVMIAIAGQPTNSPIPANVLASKLKLSPTYSQKLLRKLVLAGLIKASPGVGGGFLMAKDANQISIVDIMQAVDETSHTFHPTGTLELAINSSGITATGKINRAFQTADLVWLQVLSQTKLSDLLLN